MAEMEKSKSKKFTRRKILSGAVLGAGAAVTGFPGLNLKYANAAMPTVKSCYLPITDATPILLAHELGFFKEQGLKSERPVLIRGWSPIAEAFMAKRFNLTHLLLPIPITMRYGKNFPVKVVAWDHTNGSGLTVGKNSGIKSQADLGGKQIAVPYWYSMHNVIMQMILNDHGIEPVIQSRTASLSKNQCNLFVMKPPDMPTAMATGAIDGYIVAEPFNAVGEVLAKGTLIRFTGDVWKDHPCCVAVMHEDEVANKAYSQKVINALVKAELWALENTEKAAVLMSKDGAKYLPPPAKIIKRAMMKYDLETYGVKGTGAIQHPDWNGRRWSVNPYQYHSNTVRVVEQLKKTRMEGKLGWLPKLSGDRVQKELMYTDGVVEAVKHIGGLAKFPNVDPKNPFKRTEQIEI